MLHIPIAAPAALGLAATGALAWLVARYIRRTHSPEERERRRRIHLHVNGRLTDATIFHADSSVLQYGYQIAGVAYDAAQDITVLAQYLPRPAERLVGTAVAKYDPQNPANSIILCEHWLGFNERQN
ncbi:MAG: hypothetical protein ACKV2U_24170 [Bryobacteraceae bacterium]